MGSVGLGNNALLGAFQNKTFAEGLDLGRCQINKALGTFVADPANSFRAGMLVMQNASGLVVPSDGTDWCGVAKWNHATTMQGVVVDEAVVLVGTTASNLKHANLTFVGGNVNEDVRVNSLPDGAGTTWTETTDYVINATNGTITRNGGGGIVSGSTQYVSYRYQLTQAQLTEQQGLNFWNGLDEVSQADGRVTVIQDADVLFTTQFDTSVEYSVGVSLYASNHASRVGLFTSDPASAVFVGRCIQAPSATDPFLGVRLNPALFEL